MKRGPRIFLILVAFGAVALLGALSFPRDREPVYQGKKLSEWLGAYDQVYGDVSDQGAGTDAVRHLGTNALPCLVRWIAYEPTALGDRFRVVMWKIPIGPIRRLLLEGNGLSFAAVRGFRILGSNAAPAVPELARLISDPSRNVRRWRAMIALSGIGREGFPPLLAVLTNRAGGEFRAAECILELFRRGVDISPAVPTMLLLDREYRKSNVVNNVADPVYFVAVLAENPSFLILALTNCLSHSNGDVRLEAVSTLAQSGAEARSAVPPLVHTFDDPEVRVREAATNAVRRIAPEVLEGIEQRQIHVEKSETNPSP